MSKRRSGHSADWERTCPSYPIVSNLLHTECSIQASFAHARSIHHSQSDASSKACNWIGIHHIKLCNCSFLQVHRIFVKKVTLFLLQKVCFSLSEINLVWKLCILYFRS